MADFLPALNAIRQCLLGTVGSLRVVTAGDLAEGAYPSTTEHEAARAVTGPNFEVSITKLTPSAASPWEHMPTRIMDVEIQVRTEWTTGQELIDSERAATRADALILLEECRAALMRSPNLASDATPAATGIVSGALMRCLGHTLEREDWPRRRLSYLSRYAAAIVITQTPG
jgi:hypothetical protein